MTLITNICKDFSTEQYRNFYESGDGQKVVRLSKALGLNNGKGYSSTMVSVVINGFEIKNRETTATRENPKIWEIYKSLVRNRLAWQYQLLNKNKENDLIEQKLSVDPDTWANIVDYFTAK